LILTISPKEGQKESGSEGMRIIIDKKIVPL